MFFRIDFRTGAEATVCGRANRKVCPTGPGMDWENSRGSREVTGAGLFPADALVRQSDRFPEHALSAERVVLKVHFARMLQFDPVVKVLPLFGTNRFP
jgi:hypothetical protein